MQLNGMILRKRTQIEATNKTMFLWVAGVSIIVGFASVGSIFLFQKLVFNERVLSEKNRTVEILKSNNANIKELEAKVRVLDTNKSLADIKAKPEDRTVQVILDALPSDANSLALGASFQDKLLSGLGAGFNLEKLQVEPVAGLETIGLSDSSSNVLDAGDNQNQIAFSFAASGKEDVLLNALHNIERSIRAIDITSIVIENNGESRLMTIRGRSFYEPERVLELKDKTVK